MARKGAPPSNPQSAPGPAYNGAPSIGANAFSAMQGATANNSVGVAGGDMSFNNNPRTQQEDFAPPAGTYRSKSSKQG